MADILDLDWEDMIETMPATEEAIKIARAKRVLEAFDAEEEPTRKRLCVTDSHEKATR